MALHIVDCSRHQVERPDALDLAKAKAAGMNIVNIQLDRGRQQDVLPSWAQEYAEGARSLGMGVCTYRWLDARISGGESARRAVERMHQLGGPDGMAHAVDCEDNATQQHLRDYVTTMTGLLGRPIAIYSGSWWMKPRGWQVDDLSPYLWSAPVAGYLKEYPGDNSPHWMVAYGGWQTLSLMQYAVAPLPGTGACSLSAIRDPAVWAALTGGPMAWFVNRAISNFRKAVNAKYPHRDKATDGTIGDAAHAGTSSDHNPDPDGSVDAWDMDVELNGAGKPYAADVEALKKVFQAHEASQYWIHNDQICSRNDGWKRRSYAYAGPGRNKHDKHVHWNTRQSHENSNAPWVLTSDGDDMTPEEKNKLEAVFNNWPTAKLDSDGNVVPDADFPNKTAAAIARAQQAADAAKEKAEEALARPAGNVDVDALVDTLAEKLEDRLVAAVVERLQNG